MVDPIPKPVKDLVDAWSFRGTLIFSLSIQTFLVFFASHRKRTSRKFFLFLIWSAYLLADWSANFAAGQASYSRGDNQEHEKTTPKDSELLAFWVSFLLLHLGGPDTITTLSLEDNELWLRYLLNFGFQALASCYVFLQSLPNSLWRSMVLVFSSGVIKYTEKILAMYLASHDKFKDSIIRDPYPNYAKLMEEYAAMKSTHMPIHIAENKKPKADAEVRPEKKLTHLNILQYGYKYFNIFKGLVVGIIFTSEERDESKKFFNSLTSEEALRILEVELNFIFDALFTKAEILHNWIGATFRVIALGCLIAAFCIFQEKNKNLYGGFEIGLTYALLICGTILDSIALIMFSLSDWMFVRVRKLKEDVEDQDKDNTFDSCLNWFLSFRELKWKEYECSKNMKLPKEKQYRKSHKVLDRKFIFRRWSEYIHAHNLIEYCLWISPKKVHHTKGWIHSSLDWLIEILYIGPVIRGIGQVIASCFKTIKETIHQIYKWVDDYISRWGTKHNRYTEYYFRRCIYHIVFILCLPYYLIKKSMDFFGVQAHLDEVIFTSSDRLTMDLWQHIFTEVRNRSLLAENSESAKRVSSARGDWTLRGIQGEGEEKERKREKLLSYVMEMDYDESLVVWHIATELLYQTQEGTEDNHSDREFSKILSDYMIYLLMMQPTLMSAVAGIGSIRFEDTYHEASRFIQRKHLEKGGPKLVSEAVLFVTGTGKEPINVKGDRSKSVLFDGSLLAQELQGLSKDGGEAEMWKVVSKVWVELLSYAATNCDAIEHAAQLCKGGELISFVWLLMAHFGLGDQFQINRGNARAKLIVSK